MVALHGSSPSALIVLASAQRRGAEIQGSQLASELGARGHHADVVALVSGTTSPALDVDVLGSSARGSRTLRTLRRRARQVDVVVAYGSTTLPACAAALAGTGVPFVYRSIGDPLTWLRGRLHRARTGLAYRRADHVVALFRGAADDLQKLYGIPANAVTVIPNARNGDDYRPPSAPERRAARRHWGIDDGVPLAVTIGSLSDEKSVDLAIRAVGALPDARLLIAGDGPLRGQLEALAAEVGSGRIRLIGAVDSSREVLHAADVLLLTSRTEGMPGVVIEAGLSAVPAVSTSVGAVAELVVDGVTGSVVSSRSVSDIARAVEAVAADHELLGSAAREHLLGSFTWQAVVPAWEGILQAVARRRPDKRNTA